MAAPQTIKEAIEQVAKGPKRTKVGKTEVEEHSIDDLIKADTHVAASTAGTKNHLGLRFVKIKPGGAG